MGRWQAAGGRRQAATQRAAAAAAALGGVEIAGGQASLRRAHPMRNTTVIHRLAIEAEYTVFFRPERAGGGRLMYHEEGEAL